MFISEALSCLRRVEVLTDSQRKLVEENLNLAYWYVNNKQPYIPLQMEYDDCIQEALLSLCNAAVKYDSNSKFSFTTYAIRCISNKFAEHSRRSSRDIRKANSFPNRVFCPEELLNNIGDFGKTSDVNFVELFERFLAKNPDMKRMISVIIMRRDGMTLKEIGNELGCTSQNVSSMLKKFRCKFAKSYIPD